MPIPAAVPVLALAAGALYLMSGGSSSSTSGGGGGPSKPGGGPQSQADVVKAIVAAMLANATAEQCRAEAITLENAGYTTEAAQLRARAAQLDADAAAKQAIDDTKVIVGPQKPLDTSGPSPEQDKALEARAVAYGAQLVPRGDAWDGATTEAQRSALLSAVLGSADHSWRTWDGRLLPLVAQRAALPRTTLTLERALIIRGANYARAGVPPHPGIAARIPGYPYPLADGSLPPPVDDGGPIANVPPANVPPVQPGGGGGGGQAAPPVTPQSGVASYQHALNALGYGPLAEDGIKGPLTTAAVKRFQAANGLVVDGIVGPLTSAAMTRALAGGGAQAAPPVAAPPAGGGGFSAFYTVKPGDYPAKVAKFFTGDSNRWRELLPVNPDKATRIAKGVASVGEQYKVPAQWLDARDGKPLAAHMQPGDSPQPQARVA